MSKVWIANGCRYALDDGYQSAILPIKAHGKARPRVTVRGTYMPKAYTEARQALRMLFGTVSIHMPCAMKLTVGRRMPASWSKKQHAAAVWTFCPVKPDADNIEGWVMDALFDDDAAVVWTECLKVWSPRDVLRIELWEVNKDERAIDAESMAIIE